MNEEFNKIVNLFKNLSTNEKKETLIKEFKLSVAALEKMNNDILNNNNLLLNREIIDVNKKNPTDDDYLEAYFVYLHTINNLIINFADKISKDFFE